MKTRFLFFCLAFPSGLASAGPYAPAADQPGSTAIAFDSTAITGWASGYQDLVRGPMDIRNPSGGNATFGTGANALGPADAQNDSLPVVSLGDGGRITLTFDRPIANGPGADFAVFENGVADFLELAFVEVSSDGTLFFRFPSVSLTQTATQVGSFGLVDPTDVNNLAGKYLRGFGTPFDLAELAGTAGLDISAITHIRIQDVVGSIDPLYGTRDSVRDALAPQGHLINDPWPTNFATGGFDLDAVGVLNFAPLPEPSAIVLLASAALCAASRRGRGRRR